LSGKRKNHDRRAHDAAASRSDLLKAARELFAERGYVSTTLRDISERARVDKSMVARYFGNKEALYRAVLSEDPPPTLIEPAPRATASVLLQRWDERGPGPAMQSLIRAEVADEIRSDAKDRLERTLVNPLCERFEEQGASEPRLRAQLVIALLVGIGTVRAVGAFDELSEASVNSLIALLGPMLDSV